MTQDLGEGLPTVVANYRRIVFGIWAKSSEWADILFFSDKHSVWQELVFFLPVG